MHTQSIIAVAVGAAGVANCMPALARRAGQDYQPNGYTSYNTDSYNSRGQYPDTRQYQNGGQGGSGFPFSLLNSVTGGQGGAGGILPLGGAGGGTGGGLLSSVSSILPLGGGSGGGLGGILKRGKQSAQHDDNGCEAQCEDYCNQYFDQDWQEQQCENYCPSACNQGSGGNYNHYRPGQTDADPEQAFCSIWDQLQNYNGFGQNFGQSSFQNRQTIDRIPPGFGPGPQVVPGITGPRPGRYGGGSNQQCPLWQQGRY